MSPKTIAPVLLSLFIGAAALAAPPPTPEQPNVTEQASKLSHAFSVLHAVGGWSLSLSELADTHAKSDLVKDYARSMVAANTASDQKLMSIARAHKLDITPLNPQTEEGKSIGDRMKAEKVLLSSLQGDAFDKEYMTIVTNTQQSVIRVLDVKKAMATDPEVKQILGDMSVVVRARLDTAQDIMTKVYGDSI